MDIVIGVGPLAEALDMAEIARRAAQIATKGVRTSTVREIGGMPVAMTKLLPEGLSVMLTARGATVRMIATEAVVATVETTAIAAMAGNAPIATTALPSDYILRANI